MKARLKQGLSLSLSLSPPPPPALSLSEPVHSVVCEITSQDQIDYASRQYKHATKAEVRRLVV